MNIYATPGTKVRYTGSCIEQVRWGHNDDLSMYLTEGCDYIVHHTEVHSSHTKVILEGFEDKKFNSVSFEEAVNAESI